MRRVVSVDLQAPKNLKLKKKGEGSIAPTDADEQTV
jgi:hypothetical protein